MAVKRFILFLSFFTLARATGQLVGGIADTGKDDPEIRNVIDYAMNEFNKLSNNMYRFMPSSVEEATKQVCIQTFVYPDIAFNELIAFSAFCSKDFVTVLRK